jgi:hypothetical protein
LRASSSLITIKKSNPTRGVKKNMSGYLRTD